ncbi:MAG: sulfatase-like hydrolase/transferase, partial [Lachnospiraceae bacterium]|nr:sulfatase-like hydrolase/transferase [Lachnospiraceae bacterium]
MNELPNKNRKFQIALRILFGVLGPIIIFYLFEWFLRNPFDAKWGMKAEIQVINLVFFYLLELLLLFLLGSLRRALLAEGIFFLLLGLVEYYVQRFRGVTILPWDLFSISTAASVANNYSYKLDGKAILILVLFALFFLSLIFCRFRLAKWTSGGKAVLIRLSGILLVLAFFFGLYVPFCQSAETVRRFRIYDKLFTPTTMTWRDGTVYAFIYEMQFLSVEKPVGYNAAEIQKELEEKYNAGLHVRADANKVEGEEGKSPKSRAAHTGKTRLPNIIVVMCEAFSDPKVLGDFQTNEDYIPFVHRVLGGYENTISGYMNCSIIGGNTPNTEFEFLTGNTLAFLPEGCIPFQQYVNSEIDSMPSLLSSLGYDTLAMHPYRAAGWDRNRVYPLLGFEEMHFLDYFEKRHPKYVRDYVSDESLFDTIKDKYTGRYNGKPLFSFNVTMQNHSEYSGDLGNFHPDITIEGIEPDTLLSRYLSLQKLTDRALEDFVDYFDKQKDPTLIVFFGDHQPTDYVVEPVWTLNGKLGADLNYEDICRRYQVPFFIHANYDIEEMTQVETSANYLGNMVLEAAGIELSGYRGFLREFSESYPVLSAIRVAGPDKGSNKAAEEVSGNAILNKATDEASGNAIDNSGDSAALESANTATQRADETATVSAGQTAGGPKETAGEVSGNAILSEAAEVSANLTARGPKETAGEVSANAIGNSGDSAAPESANTATQRADET